jgi:hypothetical protein
LSGVVKAPTKRWSYTIHMRVGEGSYICHAKQNDTITAESNEQEAKAACGKGSANPPREGTDRSAGRFSCKAHKSSNDETKASGQGKPGPLTHLRMSSTM